MTSEGLGEIFEGDSADTCAGKFSLTSMGAERRVSRAQTRERGPPSALAELEYGNKSAVRDLSAKYMKLEQKQPIYETETKFGKLRTSLLFAIDQ